MVLLKNEPAASSGQDQKPMLPLDAATAGTVAVIGPHSTDYYGKEIGYYYFGAHGCMPVCGTNSTNQVRETDTLRERERIAVEMPHCCSIHAGGNIHRAWLTG
jgi:hypothetical protein